MDTGEIGTVHPPVFFLSGTGRGKDLESYRVPKDRLPSWMSNDAVLKIGDKDFYTFDSYENEDDRLFYLMILVLANLSLYEGDIELALDVGGREVMLRGEEAIMSAFSAILEDKPALAARLKKHVPLDTMVEGARRGGKIHRMPLRVAFNFVREFFAHSEQASLEYIRRHHVGMRAKAIEGKTAGARIVGYVIDIFTYRDMCKNCFKTMFLRSKESDKEFMSGEFIIRVVGSREYQNSRRDVTVDPIVPHIDRIPREKLYVKNV